jgi:PhzF family phenazine biosynthesis protein
MKIRPFKQVDVFTAVPYLGNPLAVVLEGDGLSTEDMQHFAQWTNLSETSFVLPPTPEGLAAGADYRVRIFTPTTELPFAGHPTLGTCHAWLEANPEQQAKTEFLQECAIGLVKIQRDSQQRLAFGAPPLKRTTPSPELLTQITQALGLQAQQIIAAQILDNGPAWFSLLLDSADTVLQLNPDHGQLKALGQKVGVASVEHAEQATNLIARYNREARAFGARSTENQSIKAAPELEVRAFAAAVGVIEDPVTGSLNASLAQWLIADGHLPSAYTASQGLNLGRAGRVHITQDENSQVWVGGDVVTCINGTVAL